jgi:general secretion pathway protein D
MKYSARIRSACGLFVIFCLLATTVFATGSNGKKNYERGLRYEAAQQWEKAVEEFILAVAAEPSNILYQLHYRRAIFNASQQAMRRGDALELQKDYLGAYNAYHLAYGYDNTNELAVSESERMLRLRRENDPKAAPAADTEQSNSETRMTPASAQVGLETPLRREGTQPSLPSTRPELLRVINYKGDLQKFIRLLADDLHVDVLFDSQTFQKQRAIEIKLHDVTTAKALDFIFMQEGLFFQKLDHNTIFVADQTRRPQYQELVIQTFYLANIDPEEARAMIQATIPAQQGRPAANVIPHKSTNSITVRDTLENIQLIRDILENVDKDLAEVVMEVNIYEMQHNDLLQLGNQIGSANSLGNLFGTTGLTAPFGGARQMAQQAISSLPTALGAAFLLPATSFSAFQQKDRSRLLASTQIHAFDRESSRARIGQRVPIQTAQITSLGFNNSGNSAPAGGTNGVFGGTGYPVINYEPVGLTLDFTPQVFPNLDVQVKMNIESKDVQGLGSLTPTFTERSISGTARIKNNQTMMIASVAQTNQARGRQGLPILGLVPVLGRLFTTPTHNDYQTDIIITVTPHVMRAPSVTPRDMRGLPSGSQQMPIAGSLEAMLREADPADKSQDASRSAANQPVTAAPASGVTSRDTPLVAEQLTNYIPAPKSLMQSATVSTEAESLNVSISTAPKPMAISTNVSATPVNLPMTHNVVKYNAPLTTLLPPAIGSNANVKSDGAQPASLEQVKTSASAQTAIPSLTSKPSMQDGNHLEAPLAEKVNSHPSSTVSSGDLRFEAESQELRVGEKRRLTIHLTAESPFSIAVLPLNFDPRIISVRAVSAGYSVANIKTAPTMTQTLTSEGKLLISVTLPPEATIINPPGILIQLDLEALEAGESMIGVEPGTLHLIAPEGQEINMRTMSTRAFVKR